MKITSPNGVHCLKFLHLLFAFMWIGGAMSMMLTLFTIPDSSAEAVLMKATILKQIDDWLVIGGAFGILATGLLYGFLTKWGFFHHRWLALKWIITVVMVLLGTFAMGPYIDANAMSGVDFFTDSRTAYDANISQLKLFGCIQCILIALVVVLSVLKPFKKK